MPGITISQLLVIPAISTLILSALPSSHAYIPAIPINDTSTLNRSDSSIISIAWHNPPGVYSGQVSYQLQADIPTNGSTTGALVHFSESNMGQNLTTSTPWIAFISCDRNETGASLEDDIFTLARDRGAVSALLYTTESASCLLNPRYITDFEKPLDVFATRTSPIARVIDSQFRHTNESYYIYDGQRLNESGTVVNASLRGTRFNATTYLLGTLEARNSTGQATPTDIPGPTQAPANNTPSGPAASMIALYVITGLIGVCFILMLALGWRRARMHPERYGRREEDGEAGTRTTAAGLAQAMLDTFPVIKFNRNRSGVTQAGDSRDGFDGAIPKRLDSDNDLNMVVLPSQRRSNRRGMSGSTDLTISKDDTDSETTRIDGSGRALSGKTVSRPTSGGAFGDISPPLMGVPETEVDGSGDTCPICLLDFEEGDDLRVLPCEREHVFHQNCIDPWLLQVSGSCPLCRKDFNAPPEAPSTATSSTHPSTNPSAPPTTGGFARYLAFMRRETRRTRRRADTTATATSGLTTHSNHSATGENQAREVQEEEEIESVVWGPRGRSASGGRAVGNGGAQ